MMRQVSRVTVMLMLFMLAISCNDGNSSNSSQPSVDKSDVTTTTSIEPANPAAEELSEIEKEEILFLWEEEKLARDVYRNMFDKYKTKIFSNISKSEQSHMDSVKKILDRYKLSVPVDPSKTGNFRNPEIIALYKELMERGNNSLYDAYRVGLDIELMDIEDLTARLQTVSDPEMRRIYENLLEASFNHKAAFEKNL